MSIVRFATVADVDAVAGLHADRITEGFLVTLGPAFLRRLYRRIVRSPRAFVLVANSAAAGAHRVDGFVASPGDTAAALHRSSCSTTAWRAGLAAAPGILRARDRSSRRRYRAAVGGRSDGAEILATAVASTEAGAASARTARPRSGRRTAPPGNARARS